MADHPLFLGNEIYRHSSYGPSHPLRVPRVSTVMDLARSLGWLPNHMYRTSPRARPQALRHWHTPEYIEALERAEKTQSVTEKERSQFHLGTHSNPIYPEVFRRPATGAGGAILAGELLGKGAYTSIYVPGAGTHHGMPGRANGFCYLNDVALGILSLRHHGLRRIAYVDIDAHHADGVEFGFQGDPDILMISIHEENLWPKTGLLWDHADGSAVNLPVPRGLNDSEMRHIQNHLVLPLLAQFQPDAIVLQCGADAVEEDPLAHLSLSNNAHWAFLTALMPVAPRLLVTGGGGYNPWSVGRLWTGIWATLAGFEIPENMPPAAQDVLRALSFPGHRLGRNPPEHWFTTLCDSPREGPVRTEILARVEVLLQRTNLSKAALF